MKDLIWSDDSHARDQKRCEDLERGLIEAREWREAQPRATRWHMPFPNHRTAGDWF